MKVNHNNYFVETENNFTREWTMTDSPEDNFDYTFDDDSPVLKDILHMEKNLFDGKSNDPAFKTWLMSKPQLQLLFKNLTQLKIKENLNSHEEYSIFITKRTEAAAKRNADIIRRELEN